MASILDARTNIFVRLKEVDFGTECSEMDDDALIEHGLSGRRRAIEWSLEQWVLEKVPLGVHDRNAHGGVRTTDIEQKSGRAKKQENHV